MLIISQCIFLILFFSSSSDAPRQTYKSAADLLRESQNRWGNLGSKSSTSPVNGEPEVVVVDTADGSGGTSQIGLSDKPDHNKDVKGISPNPLVQTVPTKLAPTASGERMNATFVTLARNGDIWDISRSIRQVEDRFNHKYNYDWVFLNDQPFDESFKTITSALVSGKTKYGLIPKEHWSFPEWIDQEKAKHVREEMAKKKIIYGDSVSYRHMCRYESGFFFRHPLMLDYEWYWRVEPSIELYCDVPYDPFKFMAENGKKYSFVISLLEYIDTIPTLWDSTKKFIKSHPHHIQEDNSMAFVSNDDGETYNKCHFWSNFEIGSLNWLRSDAYIDYFTSLDKDGGFFYERWGDAPVHSIAASLMLQKDEIHFFEDIAYYHIPFTHCPEDETFRAEHKCHCDPGKNFDWNGYSCKHYSHILRSTITNRVTGTRKFYELHGKVAPPEKKVQKKAAKKAGKP